VEIEPADWRFVVPGIIGLALLLPLLFSSPESKAPLQLGLPRILTGDEPHYLVTINSVILDGDLDLSNNYTAVHKGATQAGQRFAGSALDHHTVWFEQGNRRVWRWIYYADRWDHDSRGNPVPKLRDGHSPPPEGQPQYSTHPPGLALILAPFLLPFRGTAYVESAALLCSGLAMVIAMFIFRAFASSYNTDVRFVNFATAVTFLGTPIWHYGRTLFSEPYLLLFVTGSYYFAICRKMPLLAGTLIGLGMLMKPPFALLAIPLIAMHSYRREFRSVALLLLPVCVALAAVFCLDQLMFGSPLRAPQEWRQGSLFVGATGMLFSMKYGLLMVAPAIVIVIAIWPSFLRTYTSDAVVIGAGFALWYLLFASWESWSGATCYGPRYLVPVLPLLFVALAHLQHTVLWHRRWARRGALAICALAIGINGLAAIPYWNYWDSNPMLAAVQRLSNVRPQ
jgi:hypothetical protein